MGKLILVRHGETPANRDGFFACDDTPLTDSGRRQAREVSEKIRDRFQPVAVISSHLTRAQQTAEIVSRELGLPLEVIDGLQECDFGALKGREYRHYGERIANDPAYDAARPWTWVAPDGESTEQ